MAKKSTRATTKTPAATRKSKKRTATRAAGGAAPAAAEATSADTVAVGEVIDGWTVLAITNPTDVQIAQGAERRTVTLADLVRAKQQAGDQL